jgi:hypothetical protein
MRRSSAIRYAAIFGLLLVLTSGCAAKSMAQSMPEQPPPKSWYEVASRADTSTIAVVLIFGTGFIAVLGGVLPGLIRAVRGEVHTAEDFEQRIAHLEHRVASLEQQTIAH